MLDGKTIHYHQVKICITDERGHADTAIVKAALHHLPPGCFQDQWYHLKQVFLLTFTEVGIQFIYGTPFFRSMNYLYAAPSIKNNRDIEFLGQLILQPQYILTWVDLGPGDFQQEMKRVI